MIIVSDASPLIALGRIGELELLNKVFNQVIIPPAVATECTTLLHKPGAREIQTAIDLSRLIIYKDKFELIKHVSRILGAGELEAISLAKNLTQPLLIDERLGRSVAKRCGVDIIGTGGLLIAAKQKKHIKKVKPLMQKLTDNGYRISADLFRAILKHVGEA